MENKSLLQHNETVFLKEAKDAFLVTVDGKESGELLVPATFKGDLEIYVSANTTANIVVLSGTRISLHLKRYANVKLTTIDLQSQTMNIEVFLEEENSSIHISSLVVSDRVEKTNQIVFHKAVNTNSEIQNYGVCLGNGEIYFDTTGKIENGMSASNCRQLSKGIILGEHGLVSSKPILLIDEFDVKAYHGASIGKLNEDDLFYLMSRGLSMKEAYALVLSGIIQPFLDEIKNEEKRLEIQKRINDMI